MATYTYTEQLESVQDSIMKIEAGGQAYSIAGRSLSRADLEVLYDREKWLRGKVAQEARGASGMRVRGVVPQDL